MRMHLWHSLYYFTLYGIRESNLRHLEVLKVLYKINRYWFKIQFLASSKLCKYWKLRQLLILQFLNFKQVMQDLNICKFLTFGLANVNWKLIQFSILDNFLELKKIEINWKLDKIQFSKIENRKNWFGR